MLDCKVYKDLCKPGCIDHLCRLGMYHLHKPVDNDKDRIVARVLPNDKHRQFRPSLFSDGQVSVAIAGLLFFPGNEPLIIS